MTDQLLYCPRCAFGRCHSRKVTYVNLYKGRVISAPETSAYVCDVCGYQEFDHLAIEHLHSLTSEDRSISDDTLYVTKSAPVELQEANKPPQPKT
jgi:YgiT-type zinc finger domain-containing protein